MPKKRGFILSRLSNLTTSAKRLIEHLSPRKKHKKRKIEEPDTSDVSTLDFHCLINNFRPHNIDRTPLIILNQQIRIPLLRKIFFLEAAYPFLVFFAPEIQVPSPLPKPRLLSSMNSDFLMCWFRKLHSRMSLSPLFMVLGVGLMINYLCTLSTALNPWVPNLTRQMT